MKKYRAKIGETPDGWCDDSLTKDKWYDVIQPNFISFIIKNDNGETIFCLIKNCFHIGCGNWIIEEVTE